MVRNAKDVAPTLPKLEMIAKPIGPQLQAPAAAPIKEPNTLPPILPFEFFKMFIL